MPVLPSMPSSAGGGECEPATIVGGTIVAIQTALTFWQSIGFEEVRPSRDGIEGQLPANVIATWAVTEAGHAGATSVLGAIGVAPKLTLRNTPYPCSLYKVAADDVAETLSAMMPRGTVVQSAGGWLALPHGNDFDAADYHIADLTELTTLPIEPPIPLDAVSETNPLLPYSLRGKAADFEERAKESKPLLDEVCLSGQATVWYAPPNVGKTLLALNMTVQAVQERRIAPGNVFYVNADDNSAGLAAKLRIMDDLGAHTLVPGFHNFRANQLADLFRTSAVTDESNGVLVIIDTVKKFTSLMDKRDCSVFADACRQFVMHGGTVLALAHTTKNPNPDGKLRYGGTTDLIEDFDAAYLLQPITAEAEKGEQVVQFSLIKRRADNPETVAYAYAGETGISYEERLASVRPMDRIEFEGFKWMADQKTDAEIISVATACINTGTVKKMELAKAIADRASIPERAAIRLLEKYTGPDPDHHRWTFSIRARGAKLYELLPEPVP